VPPPPAFANNDAPAEELTSQMRIGGLGLHFIRNLMDEVSFSSDRLRGNELVMVKKLNAK
jgi:anti-sigma regulatory factor (Ser/Thr protein kinase)